MTEVCEEVLRARAYLLRVAEPPGRSLCDFVAEHGPVRAAQLVRTGRTPREVTDEVQARRHLWCGEEEEAAARAVGSELLVPEHADWPSDRLSRLDQASLAGQGPGRSPLALWVRGARELGALSARSVSVVGARAATGYGEQVAAELAHDLAGRGFTVVSGAAYGVDGAAHRGALAVRGRTMAVLASGLDAGSPAGHQTLLRRIVSGGGAVVSEYPPGTPPARHRFLVRNRLIAALGEGLVLVEAGRRSGARNTAGAAAALGRVVMAVPGPVTSLMSVGCHDLLRDGGALLVTSADDVAEAAGRLGSDLPEDQGPGSPSRATDALSGEQLRVLDSLDAARTRSAAEVSVLSGVAPAVTATTLAVLRNAGLVCGREGGWVAVRR
ncbi:DNA-processing protein DprA [Actinoalloteichus caeruleus]|uniref:DNA-processing protein DprA n=1 Tax=Actinoalloteichus cyanogriseus TaxID=2893586 RepID=UPI0009DDADA6|nr:DNA-processing protein DprA [Actinoalloteichus caeruleus]